MKEIDKSCLGISESRKRLKQLVKMIAFAGTRKRKKGGIGSNAKRERYKGRGRKTKAKIERYIERRQSQ